jgi:peptidoglycan hydrolase-like protein with peptidoglycan-binding domain
MAESALQRGSEGSEVSMLQQTLIDLNFKPGEVDGVFGVLTESALKMFQATGQLEADGILGQRTAEKLAEATGQAKEGELAGEDEGEEEIEV